MGGAAAGAASSCGTAGGAADFAGGGEDGGTGATVAFDAGKPVSVDAAAGEGVGTSLASTGRATRVLSPGRLARKATRLRAKTTSDAATMSAQRGKGW